MRTSRTPAKKPTPYLVTLALIAAGAGVLGAGAPSATAAAPRA